MIHYSSEAEKSSIVQLSTCELRGKGVVGEEAGVQVAQRRDPVYGVPEIIQAWVSVGTHSLSTNEQHVKMFHVPRNGDPARRRQLAAPESTQLWKPPGEPRNLHRPNPASSDIQSFRLVLHRSRWVSLSVKHALSASGSRW
jgi:hypothetical protein